jgi:hypothetical protein
MVSDNKDLLSQFKYEGFATSLQGNCQESLISGIFCISLLGKTDTQMSLLANYFSLAFLS